MARIVSTLWAPGVEAWRDVTVVDRRVHSRLGLVRRVAREARTHDAVILNGSARFHERYQDPIAAALLARRRDPPALVMAETAWDVGSAPLGRGRLRPEAAVRAAVRAIDGPHVTYCTFCQEERVLFCDTFGIDPDRVEVVRASHTLWSRAHREVPYGDYVFSGGSSLRDWPTLLEAVRGLDVPVRVATTNSVGPAPANVQAGPVSPDRFTDLLIGAGPVVLPISVAPRAAGLLTYFNAMALGKPTIVTDTVGVREYVEHERTGLIVPPGDPAALREAILWTLDPANRGRVDAMREAAREYARDGHPPNRYWERLREVAEATFARRPR